MNDDDFMSSISTLLSNTENLLLDLDTTLPGLQNNNVIEIPDSTSTTPARVNRRRRGGGGARVRGAGWRTRQQRSVPPVLDVVDLCSPLTTNIVRNPLAGSNRRNKRQTTAAIAGNNDVVVVPDEPSPHRSIPNTAPSQQDSAGLSCPICISQLTAPVSTMCGHVFCKECLAQWLKTTKKCPVCKAGGAKLKTHPIFIN